MISHYQSINCVRKPETGMEVLKHFAVYNFKYKKVCSDQNIPKVKVKFKLE